MQHFEEIAIQLKLNLRETATAAELLLNEGIVKQSVIELFERNEQLKIKQLLYLKYRTAFIF